MKTLIYKKHLKNLRKHEEIKLLIKFANKYNFKVLFLHNCADGGLFESHKKTIKVAYRNKSGQFISILDVSHSLAHEIQHLKHFIRNKYRSYYVSKAYNALIGIKAEHDCNKFADAYIKEAFGIAIKMKRYKIKDVCCWDKWQEHLKNKREERKQNVERN
jgi:hypothetical protein